MELATDASLGSYKIESLIGRGGMGEVYRARDTGLDRQVAIKVLPESFAANPERVARFEREARLLATLSHQNIAGIYGLEEADGLRYLVLELVEGVTLKDHLEKSATPVEETLRICCQIADAVAAAHEKGIIHRDLKPANIMITADDTVKVLDFGIAKALDPSGSATSMAYAATLSADHHTAAGTMVGTPAYMSPEQARGKPIDKRSDIWSFGCVLYECCTGETAFGGETVTDTLAKILERDPDYTRIPAATPPTIQMLMRRCLAKDRKKRLHDIGDARVQIEEAIADPSGSTLGLSGSYVVVSSPPSTKTLLPWLITVLFALLAAVALWRPWSTATTMTTTASIKRLAIVAPELEVNWSDYDLSPDGQSIVFVARPPAPAEGDKPPQQLFIRRLDRIESTPLQGTERPSNPAFSPSGEWIAFVGSEPTTGRRLLKRVALDGSPATTVCDVTSHTVWGALWLSEQSILLRGARRNDELLKVTVEDGQIEFIQFEIEDMEGIVGVAPTAVLPDGRSLLANSFRMMGTQAQSDAYIVSIEDWSCRKLLENAGSPRYAATGHLVFERDELLLAAPFDPVAGSVTGGIKPLVSALEDFALAQSGVLIYRPTMGAPEKRRLMIADAQGQVQPLSPVRRPFRRGLSISPDGRWLGVGVWDPNSLPRIWLIDMNSGEIRPLTEAKQVCFNASFSPDGQQVSYMHWDPKTPAIMVAPLDGSAPARQVYTYEMSAGWTVADCWTADGKSVLITKNEAVENDSDILLLDLHADEPIPILSSSAREQNARLSPDNSWLLYNSNETGEFHYHLRPYDTETNKVGPSTMVTTEPGASDAIWSHDGSTIYYVDRHDHLQAMTMTTEPELTLSDPRTVLDVDELNVVGDSLVPLPDGERFVFIQRDEQERDAEHLNVVLNWFEELKKKVPVQVTRSD